MGTLEEAIRALGGHLYGAVIAVTEPRAQAGRTPRAAEHPCRAPAGNIGRYSRFFMSTRTKAGGDFFVVASLVIMLAGCAESRTDSERVATAGTAATMPPSAPGKVVTTAARSVASAPPTTETTVAPALRNSTADTPAPTSAAPAADERRPVRPRSPYSDWDWRSPGPGSQYTSQNLELTVLSDPGTATPYFFAHQFGFDGGAGGYVGLQTRGRLNGDTSGPKGKIALFSIFGGCDDRAGTSGCPRPHPAIGASARPGLLNGSSCSPMTTSSGGAPEGPGATCRLPLDWRQGVAYRLGVALVGPHVWQATVVDTTTGVSTVIGQIRVPDAWGGLAPYSVTWIEYYGDTGDYASCADVPRAQALWRQGRGVQSTPGLLGVGARAVVTAPTITKNHLAVGDGLCSNSSVTELVPKETGSVQTVGGS